MVKYGGMIAAILGSSYLNGSIFISIIKALLDISFYSHVRIKSQYLLLLLPCFSGIKTLAHVQQ